MRAGYLLAASSVIVALVVAACADADETLGATPTEDAGTDAAKPDAEVETDSGAPLPDGGEWFPATCAKGALCAVGVEALDPRTVLFALGVNGGEVTAVGTMGSVVERTSGTWRRTTVGEPDALHGVATLGGEIWTAGSINGVFTRAASGDPAWSGHRPGGPDWFGFRNWAINGLFSEPTGSWVWAATATSCNPGTGNDGVVLIRLKKQPEWLQLETIIQDPITTCITMNALDGAGGTLWVAGDKGVLYKVTDLEASPPTVLPENSQTTRTLLGVWAEPRGHVYVVGKNGTVQHRPPGGVFAPLGGPVPAVAYHAVRGTSPTDVWIAGEDATVMHYDGQSWTRIPVAGIGDRRPKLRAIAAIAPDRVWVAGDNVLLGLATVDGRAP